MIARQALQWLGPCAKTCRQAWMASPDRLGRFFADQALSWRKECLGSSAHQTLCWTDHHSLCGRVFLVKYGEVWVGSSPDWFLQHVLGCLHPRLGLAIGLATSRATSKMLKIPCSGEVRKLVRCKWQTIVIDHFIRYDIAGKVTLQLQSDGAGFDVWQPIHLPQIVVVVYRDQVILAFKGRDVCGNLPLWTRWDFVGHQCLLCVCLAVEFSTCFTCGDMLFHSRKYAWPVDTFVCTPQIRLYSEVERVNL